jgi:hypothetical protein
MSEIITEANVVDYYTNTKDYNRYAVMQVIQNDSIALAAYNAWLVARIDAAVSNPPTS